MIPLLLWLGCATSPDAKKAAGALDTAASESVTETTPSTPTAPTVSEPCTPEPGPRLLRRLTHAEYGAAVRMLLSTDLRPEEGFVPDEVVHGYTGDASLSVSSLLAEQYRVAAEDLATDALGRLDLLLPCAETDRSCADRSIADLGLRFYRRPLTTDERTALVLLYDEVAREDGFEEGIRWVLVAMLQSPAFLYRSELGARSAGDVFSLSDWELATALSFGVLGVPPDDALLSAAGAGRLSTPDGLADELRRLIDAPGATSRIHEAVSDQLHLERLPQVVRDATVYPELTPEIRALFAEETRRLVVDVAAADGSWADLLSAEHTWLNADLAALYGLPSPEDVDAEGWGRVALPEERAGGILTHGSVLTTHALPTSSSPIHRGVMVRERLLCQALPPPPADLDISPPPVDPSLSTRERYAAHSDIPECAGCHVLIDAIGFGFEHFDGMGRHREVDGIHPVDATGEIVGSPSSDVYFDGVGELAVAIAGDTEACWVERGARWLTGLDLPECDLDAFGDATAAEGGQLHDVWHGWVALPHFGERVGGPDERDAPIGGGAWTLPDAPETTTGDTGDEPLEDIVVDSSVNTDWGTGYCMDVEVTNHSDAPVRWSIVLEVVGTVTSRWSSVWEDIGGGSFLVEGEEWNAELAPDGSTGFGYCADR